MPILFTARGWPATKDRRTVIGAISSLPLHTEFFSWVHSVFFVLFPLPPTLTNMSMYGPWKGPRGESCHRGQGRVGGHSMLKRNVSFESRFSLPSPPAQLVLQEAQLAQTLTFRKWTMHLSAEAGDRKISIRQENTGKLHPIGGEETFFFGHIKDSFSPLSPYMHPELLNSTS